MTRGATVEPREFNPRRISPSRVNQLVSCGIAFRMKYLEGLPEETSGSAALFGSVVHLALEKWALDRDQDLFALMKESWIEFCSDRSPKLAEFIQEYQAISSEVIRAEFAASVAFEERMKKPCKAPRMTKEFKNSAAAKKLGGLVRRWHPILEEHSPYRFTEFDPLPKLYDESLVVAKRYEQRWGHLPNALYVEQGFEVEWRGFTLHGYIDTVELLINPQTGDLQGVSANDYKTYAKPPAEYKDWRQTVMYHAAVGELVKRGVIVIPEDVEVYIGIDYVRWTNAWVDHDGGPFPSRRFWKVSEEDYDRLERELTAYVNTVEGGNFLPAEKGRNPDFCGYPSSCCLRSTVAAGGSSTPVEVVL